MHRAGFAIRRATRSILISVAMIQTVARLDFQRGHPLGQKVIERGPGRWPTARPHRRPASPRRMTRCPRRRARSLHSWRLSSRISNSRARSPPKTIWVWQSISPGVTSRPSRSSARGAGIFRRQIGLGPDPSGCARPPSPRHPARSGHIPPIGIHRRQTGIGQKLRSHPSRIALPCVLCLDLMKLMSKLIFPQTRQADGSYLGRAGPFARRLGGECRRDP